MMVRINLAPSKKRGPSGDTLWRVVAIMAILLLAELVLLYMVHSSRTDEVQERQQLLAATQQQVASVEAQIAAIPDLGSKITELEARETELANIAAVRFGPQHVMEEMKRILTRPRTKPTIKEAKDAGWNVAWEAESVYLKRMVESSPGVMTLEGSARSLDDVAEFWLRLRTSPFFQGVRLHGITEQSSKNGITVQKFAFTAKTNFYYQTKQGVELMNQIEAAKAQPNQKKGGSDG